MLSQDHEIHLIKSVISLKKVCITVRFPCSISFALKHESNIIDHKAVYELVKGECSINKSIQIELEIPYFRGRYQERKVSLLIYMVSSNGKIPAGTVTLNPTDQILLDKRAPLEKCPDKNAYAVYTESFEKATVVKGSTEKGRLSNLASSTISGYNQLRRSGTHLTSSSQQKQEKEGDETYNIEVSAISPRNEVNSSGIKLTDHKDIKECIVASGSQKNMKTPKPPKLRLDSIPRRGSFETLDKAPETKRSFDGSDRVGHQEWQLQTQRTRILKLQQERASYSKQISRLRGSLVRVDSEERIQLQGEIDRVKNTNEELYEEVRKLRSKSKDHEKKQKQSTTLMKELRDQLDKKKSKIYQLDSSKHQIQGQLSEKDKQISLLQNEKKRLQQGLQEEKSLQASIHKRAQIKENSYKQQLRKMNERLTLMDAERQKAVFDYSNLLNQFQSSEKKHQIAIREKEKCFNQQRIKLNKKNGQLVSENSSLNGQLHENYNSLRDYEYIKKKYSEQETQSASKIRNIKEINESLQKQNKLLKEETKSVKQRLIQLQQSTNAQKATLKKKLNELNQQLQIHKEKVQKLQSLNHSYDATIKQLQAKLQRQIKQKTISNSKLDELMRIQQKLAHDQQANQKLVQTLSVQNINHNQRLNDFKSRLQSQRKRYQVMQVKYEQGVKCLINSKEYLQNEVEELKWQLEKQLEKYEILNIKHRELTERMMELNQQVIFFEEQVTDYQKNKEELLEIVRELKTNIHNYQLQQRKFQENYRRIQSENMVLQQKCKEFEHQRLLYNQQSISSDNIYQVTLQSNQKSIQKLRQQVKHKQMEIEGLKNEQSSTQNQLSKAQTQINMQNDERSARKDIDNGLRSDYTALVAKYDSSRQESQQIRNQLEKTEEVLHQCQQLLSSSKNSIEKAQIELYEYKSATLRALQQLFTLISNQEYDIRSEIPILQSLPDEKLSRLQLESLRKYHIIRGRLQKQSLQLKESVQYLERQLTKLQAYIEKIEQQQLRYIYKSQQELSTLKQEKQDAITELQGKLNDTVLKWQDYKNEIQYLNGEIIKYEDTINSLTEEIQAKKSKEAIMANQIHQLDQVLFDIRAKQVKQKLLFTSQAGQLKEILVLQREHHAQIAVSLKAQIKDKQKQLCEKSQEIKRLIMSESDFKMQIGRMAEEAKELMKRVEQEKQGKALLERHMKDKERLVKQLQEQTVALRKQEERFKEVDLAKQQRITHLQNEYHNLEVKLSQSLQNERSKYRFLEQSDKRQRQKRQKLQSLRNKLQQQNKEARQKCVRLESQNEFYKFFKAESTKKLQQYEKTKEQALKEHIKSKQAVLRSEKEIVSYENKIYKLEMEIESLLKQKALMQQRNRKNQQKLAQNEEKCDGLQLIINQLQSRERQTKRRQETIKSLQVSHQRNLNDLRAQLNKLSQQTNNKSLKIKQLQQKLQNSSFALQTQKDKGQVQLDNEKNIFQLKYQTLDQMISTLQNELQFQKEQAVKEVEGANAIIQQLNQVIRQKEEMLQYKSEVISEQTVRSEEFNTQLAECLAKWEKEKETYMPTAAKMGEFRQEMARMNAFIGDLDGRSRQLIQINKRKMQQGVPNRPSITEMLKELYVLMQKNKNKILSRCPNEKEREAVIADFKALQDKLDMTLKSPQVAAARHS